jgi:hypothetical protein
VTADNLVVSRQFRLPLIKDPNGAADRVDSHGVHLVTGTDSKGIRVEFYHDGKWYEQSANGPFLKNGYDIDFPEDKD